MKIRITIDVERVGDVLTFGDVRRAARAGVLVADSNDTIPRRRTMDISNGVVCECAIEVVEP